MVDLSRFKSQGVETAFWAKTAFASGLSLSYLTHVVS